MKKIVNSLVLLHCRSNILFLDVFYLCLFRFRGQLNPTYINFIIEFINNIITGRIHITFQFFFFVILTLFFIHSNQLVIETTIKHKEMLTLWSFQIHQFVFTKCYEFNFASLQYNRKKKSKTEFKNLNQQN